MIILVNNKTWKNCNIWWIVT